MFESIEKGHLKMKIAAVQDWDVILVHQNQKKNHSQMFVFERRETLELDNFAGSYEIIDCRILKAFQVACQGLQEEIQGDVS